MIDFIFKNKKIDRQTIYNSKARKKSIKSLEIIIKE